MLDPRRGSIGVGRNPKRRVVLSRFVLQPDLAVRDGQSQRRDANRFGRRLEVVAMASIAPRHNQLPMPRNVAGSAARERVVAGAAKV